MVATNCYVARRHCYQALRDAVAKELEFNSACFEDAKAHVNGAVYDMLPEQRSKIFTRFDVHIDAVMLLHPASPMDSKDNRIVFQHLYGISQGNYYKLCRLYSQQSEIFEIINLRATAYWEPQNVGTIYGELLFRTDRGVHDIIRSGKDHNQIPAWNPEMDNLLGTYRGFASYRLAHAARQEAAALEGLTLTIDEIELGKVQEKPDFTLIELE